jgi:N-acylglucosamine-6-phosphate 2-epimerase
MKKRMTGVATLFKKSGIIVSCQALPDEPLYGDQMMVRMAQAAQQGGAIGIRTNGFEDIKAIKHSVPLPVIGLIKRDIPGSDIFITPTMEEVEAILDAGADIVALDVTDRENRHEQVRVMVERIHRRGALAMADISTYAEGIAADRMGFDFVSTTLSGYTSYSPQQEEPDLDLVRMLGAKLKLPVVAEGRIWCPQDAVNAMKAGAKYVVVGSAITRPQLITTKYTSYVSDWLDKKNDNAAVRLKSKSNNYTI